MGHTEAILVIIIIGVLCLLVWGERVFGRPKMRVGKKYRVTKVVKISDGDTFDVLIHGRHERIRPASYDAREHGEAGACEAVADLEEILRSAVSIRFDHTGNDTRNVWRAPDGETRPRRIGRVWVRESYWRAPRMLGAIMVERSMIRAAAGEPQSAMPWLGSRDKSWGRCPDSDA